jgi:hypothetical protein
MDHLTRIAETEQCLFGETRGKKLMRTEIYATKFYLRFLNK